jgi:hypothetical protein
LDLTVIIVLVVVIVGDVSNGHVALDVIIHVIAIIVVVNVVVVVIVGYANKSYVHCFIVAISVVVIDSHVHRVITI